MSDFFAVGSTYADVEYRWQFRCDTVTSHPQDGERTALGWRYWASTWEPYAYGEDDWDIHQSIGGVVVPASPARVVPPLTVYRASHDSIAMGLYTTPATARQHCEALVWQEEPAGSIRRLSWWTDDIGDDAEYELHITPAETGGLIRGTGYVVTPLTVASEHDEEAGE